MSRTDEAYQQEEEEEEKFLYDIEEESKVQDTEILDQCSSTYLNCLPLSIFKNPQKAKLFACKYSKTEPKGIVNNPLQNKRGELFCKHCYAIAKKENVMVQRLTAFALPLKQILNDLEVYCLNKDQGCNYENRLENLLANHLPNDCQFMKMHCPNINCNAIIERRFLFEHFKQCPYQIINCKKCDEKFQALDLSAHEGVCPESEISCENCKIVFKRKFLIQHKQSECTFIQCNICTYYVQKTKLKEHILQQPALHFAKFKQLKNQVAQLKLQLKKSKEKTQNLLKLANSRLAQELYFGTECSNCKAKLTEKSPQFYCFLCNIYFCQQCGDQIASYKEGTESLIHQHYLVYIQVKNKNGMKNLDLHRFGMNLWFKQDSPQSHQIQCDGCGQKPNSRDKSARYICLSCPNFECLQPNTKGFQFTDFCQRCIDTLHDRDQFPENFEALKLRTKIEAPFHDFDSCIYLKVQFANHHYSNF